MAQRLRRVARHLALAPLTPQPTAAADELALGSTITLAGGVQMPMFGLGTFAGLGGECQDACTAALEMGYVMLDTAAGYDNEEEVGASLAGRGRDETFVVTKHTATGRHDVVRPKRLVI